ncbi:site-specific integrase [Nocardiopsis sp. NPDC006139]|uniref:tyrosine-type recombinase/integrase n=1 Tax=Nocardiopsis sp. NPDC006139 TaxID=3154578 RepID=UPI0033B22DEB
MEGKPALDHCGEPRYRRLGKRCRHIGDTGHGSWYFSIPLPRPSSDTGRHTYLKRGGYPSRDEAHQMGAAAQCLLAVPDRDDDAGRREVAAVVVHALDNGAELPDIETVRERYLRCQPLAPAPTLDAWLDHWLPSKRPHLAPSTFLGYETHIRLYLKPHLGRYRIDRLRVDHVQDMLELIEEENELIALARTTRDPALCKRFHYRRHAGPTTKRAIVSVLRSALNAARARQMIAFNPASHVSVPRSEHQRPQIWTDARVRRWVVTGEVPGPVMVWTPAQTGAFLDHVRDDPLEALFQLIAYRGPRRGEACGLSWFDIDLRQRTAEIWQQLVLLKGEPVWARLKTAHSRRTLALDEVTVEALQRHRERQACWKARAGAAWQDSGLVFTTELGAALRPDRVLRRFRELTARAGLPPIRLHDLRHGAATLLLAAGTHVKVVQETLGHSRVSTTLDVYTSVLPELFHESAQAVAELVPRKGAAG